LAVVIDDSNDGDAFALPRGQRAGGNLLCAGGGNRREETTEQRQQRSTSNNNPPSNPFSLGVTPTPTSGLVNACLY